MATTTITLGAKVEIGFVFRDNANALTSPATVTIEIEKPDGTEVSPVLTQADAEVTIGATLGTDLASDLGLTVAENAAGTGIVQVVYTPDSAGTWQFYCVGTGTVGAARHSVVVKAKFD